jgi:hypothetical protein
MNKLKLYSILFGVFFICNMCPDAQAQWQKKQASIMTPWSENIDPDDVFSEYPRPQMVRDSWVNLNGVWNLAKKNSRTIGNYSDFTSFNQQILVPFPVESALSGIMDTDYDNLNKSYAYKRTFTIPASDQGKRILLHFGAVDWQCVVFVNQTNVGEHKGGYDAFTLDITGALKSFDQSQELVVQVYDPTKGGQPRGKQDTNPGGIWYTPSTGIWQTVWYEAVNVKHISNFTLVPDVDNSAVKIKIDAENADGANVEVVVLDGTTEVARQTILAGTETAIAISNPKLWSPDSPFLYNLTFALKDGNEVVDHVASYFGMRKISLGKLRGKPFMFLNDKPVFHYGTLDQGFWPDGLYSAPSYEALRWDLEKTKELGFNMVRKHIKIEPARWYYYCDSIGLMVWQDMGNPIETSGSLGDGNWVKENYFRETTNIINCLRNYPSILVWVPYNEGWGQFDAGNNPEHTRKGVELVRQLDNTRLINQSSGWTNFELGDIIDKHSYTTPGIYENPFNHRANVCGETGGYSLVFDGHIWSHSTNIYNTLKDSEELTTRLEELNRIGFALTAEGFAGLVYTQITDVEEELNGFFTYDRKISKLNDAQKVRFKAGIEKLKTKALLMDYIMPTAMHSDANEWKYLTGGIVYTPPTGWYNKLDLDESGWQSGMAGFGAGDPPNTKIRTEWDTRRIYLRKKIKLDSDLSEEEKANLKLYIYHDEDFIVYINGVQAASDTGFSTNYQLYDISQAAKNTLKFDGEDNLFAIRCTQTSGGQYIDLGIVVSVEVDIDKESTSSNPPVVIEINDAAGLDAIRNDLTGFYSLTANIDLSGFPNFTPIGTQENPFKGYLEGNKHVIKNMTINQQGNDCQGLFAYTYSAYISELELLEPNIKGAESVGALVGKAINTTIRRIVVTNPQINGLDRVGGIVGKIEEGNASFISECYVVEGQINARASNAGGMVGTAYNTCIENSYFTGTVIAPLGDAKNKSGGILGLTENTAVQFRGVASLATKVNGGSSAQFAPGAFLLVEQSYIYARKGMELSVNSYGANRAAPEQIKDVSEFKKQTFYESMGWDFENVWKMTENGFPVFKTQSTAIQTPHATNTKNMKVYPSNGRLTFETLHPTSVWVYNTVGTLTARFDMQNCGSITLPQGVYIVKSVSQGIVESVKIKNI